MAFAAKALVANAIVFAIVFAGGEVAVRAWREGGLLPGLWSMFSSQPVPAGLGVGDWLQSDPVRGYVLRPGVHGTNALHIRHGPVVDPKPAGMFRLLVLGDSVAFPDDGFVSRLRAMQAQASSLQVEILNAAVPGYTTWQQARHFEALVDAVRPDALLLQYCCNDNHRFLHQLTSDGGWLVTEEARRALLPDDPGWIGGLLRWSYLAIEARRLLLASRPRDPRRPWLQDPAFAPAWRPDGWPLVEHELRGLVSQCAERRIAFGVVAAPYEPQLDPAAADGDVEHARTPQRRLAAICADLGVPLLDLLDGFAAARVEGLYTDGIHFSPAGHAAAARALWPFARRAGLLPSD